MVLEIRLMHGDFHAHFSDRGRGHREWKRRIRDQPVISCWVVIAIVVVVATVAYLAGAVIAIGGVIEDPTLLNYEDYHKLRRHFRGE